MQKRLSKAHFFANLVAIAAAASGQNMPTGTGTYYRPRRKKAKTPLTAAQQLVRKKNKIAKKSRQRNR